MSKTRISYVALPVPTRPMGLLGPRNPADGVRAEDSREMERMR